MSAIDQQVHRSDVERWLRDPVSIHFFEQLKIESTEISNALCSGVTLRDPARTTIDTARMIGINYALSTLIEKIIEGMKENEQENY